MKVTIYGVGNGEPMTFENVDTWYYLHQNLPPVLHTPVTQSPNRRVVFVNPSLAVVEVQYEPGDGQA